jgi:putative tributyrin esterase
VKWQNINKYRQFLKYLHRFCILIGITLLVPIHGADTITIPSGFLPYPDTVLVYRPLDMQANQSLPTVVLLHGYNGNYKTWGKYMDLQQLCNMYNCMIACPDGFNSYYLNSPQRPEIKYADFFFQELVPNLFHLYGIDSTKIFITGNSMGGYGALYLFMQNPGFFRAVGSISAVADLNESSNKFKELTYLLGPASKNQKPLDLYSPIHMMDTVLIAQREILISCGRQDVFYKSNVRLAEICLKNSAQVNVYFEDGLHNKKFWTDALDWQFKTFFENILKDGPCH